MSCLSPIDGFLTRPHGGMFKGFDRLLFVVRCLLSGLFLFVVQLVAVFIYSNLSGWEKPDRLRGPWPGTLRGGFGLEIAASTILPGLRP